MSHSFIIDGLHYLLSSAEEFNITNDDRLIIFSDLHIGNGGAADDFRENSDIFTHCLREYYLSKNFRLILNGDIEDLYKFPLYQILNQYQPLYEVFEAFAKAQALFKTYGNHDLELKVRKKRILDIPISNAFLTYL